MKYPIQLIAAVCSSVRVTQRTEWFFLEITDSDRFSEVVEITCGDDSFRAVDFLTEMMDSLKGKSLNDEKEIASALNLEPRQLLNDRPMAAAVSALRTAMIGLQARHQNKPMMEVLGGVVRESIPLYANINRSLLGERRTAQDFASVAERAVKDGFSIVKCAPFDEVRPPTDPKEILAIAGPGLERVVAVRSAVGPDIKVLVDCHSRFETPTAKIIAVELANLGVGWFEEPLEPGDDPEGLSEVAGAAAMPLAGGESGYGKEFFSELMAKRAVGIVMPDIKFCGGVGEAYRISLAAKAYGCGISLHSPSGPVSQLASAHATAATPDALALEHAVYEAPWRSELIDPSERIENGNFWFPEGKGIGARLNNKAIQERGSTWRI